MGIIGVVGGVGIIGVMGGVGIIGIGRWCGDY